MASVAAQEREVWLLGELERRGVVKLQATASRFGVSEMTIRRDLDALEAQGLARRIRGGAVSLKPASFEVRSESAIDEKRLIAEKLVPLVPEEGFIAFDSSTTVLQLAQMLQRATDLTVLTNSPRTFNALLGKPGITAAMVAGTFDSRSDSLVGPLVAATTEQVTCDAYFCSATAVSPSWGCSEGTLEEAEVKRAFAERAGRIVLAVNDEKLGTVARARSLEFRSIHVMVTELDPSSEALDPYRSEVRDIK